MLGSADYYWLTAAIFVLAFVAILSERIHKTKVALFGGALMVALPILSQDEAFYSERYGIDYNVVFLLISMMIIVKIVSLSGIFEWAAIRAAKLAGGRPLNILVIFVLLTAVASAFLDNVTTVLFIAPITLLIADELDVDPIPFLLAEALASNIGGTATLIGDPPNIIIASRAGLSFMDFLVHVAPAVLVMMAAFVVAIVLLFGGRLTVEESKRQRILAMDERTVIKDASLARRSLVVLALTIAGFALHGVLHYEPATIALMGAGALLLISRRDPHEILADVEWPTIFFFIGLFLMVGGVAKVGLIEDVSQLVMEVTKPTPEDTYGTSMVILWFSAVASAVVDNIPYVATMAPLVVDMANNVFHNGELEQVPAETLLSAPMQPVWWALSLGSCLGGNGTPIGASANVIVLGIAEKSGIMISFLRFVAYGVPTVLVTLAISHVYLTLRYF